MRKKPKQRKLSTKALVMRAQRKEIKRIKIALRRDICQWVDNLVLYGDGSRAPLGLMRP